MKSIIKKVVPAKARAAMRDLQWKADKFGLAYQCCVCGARLKEFELRGIDAPVLKELQIAPGGPRRVTCPHCQSYDRERLLYLFLRDKTDLFTSHKRILHFAPETCIFDKLSKGGHDVYATVDLFPEANVEFLTDICRLSFQTGSFDVLLCCHVLEHIPDDRLAMRELQRVVKPGGWAVIQVPMSMKLQSTIEDPSVTSEEERLKRFGQKDHVRVYAETDYLERLRESGWCVEVVDLIAEMGDEKATKYALFKGEKIYLCRKPA
ncbi:MAG: class I SAM-dependent methyltransferase [Fimbriimonadaceae bacterium]|nr:class I SAM-dependent methyltransferase [Fimbriimonadaceae bacterium]